MERGAMFFFLERLPSEDCPNNFREGEEVQLPQPKSLPDDDDPQEPQPKLMVEGRFAGERTIFQMCLVKNTLVLFLWRKILLRTPAVLKK